MESFGFCILNKILVITNFDGLRNRRNENVSVCAHRLPNIWSSELMMLLGFIDSNRCSIFFWLK
jgi:hypothetical protein